MFAKSKIVAPIVALLVACMAVEAAPAAPPIPLPQSCSCSVEINQDFFWGNGTYTYDLQFADYAPQLCASLGPNIAVYNSTHSRCLIQTLSGYNTFTSDCDASYLVDVAGGQHFASTGCTTIYPVIPLPASCVCDDASGVNAAVTQQVCTDAALYGATLVDGECVVGNTNAYTIFTQVCNTKSNTGAPVCTST